MRSPAPRFPPGPKANLILGHLRELNSDQLGFTLRCRDEFGDIVPLRVGPLRVLLLSHPDYVEQVLVHQNRSFKKGTFYRLLEPLLGNGLFTSEGEFWVRQRRMAQPAFHRGRIVSYATTMVSCAETMLDRWRDMEVLDLHHEMMRVTLQIVAKTLFDADIEDEAGEVGDALRVALAQLQRQIGSPLFLLPTAIPTPGRIRLRRAVRRLDAIVYKFIADRRASGQPRPDLLSMLLEARAEDGTGMSDKQLRDECMTLVLAGHETTALALTWALYLLAQHPEVEATLLQELNDVLGDGTATADDLARLSYAEMVVMETMRLYPPLPAIGRQAIADCEIGGFRIAAGTNVAMDPWVIHRDPRYFTHPERFEPERWKDGLASRLPTGAYFPFSAGPRRCIGHAFAMMEAVLVLATISRRFEVRPIPDHSVTPQIALTLRPRYGVKVQLHARRVQAASGGPARVDR